VKNQIPRSIVLARKKWKPFLCSLLSFPEILYLNETKTLLARFENTKREKCSTAFVLYQGEFP
jgi:hypothetical protein